jgi:hypothetical protein
MWFMRGFGSAKAHQKIIVIMQESGFIIDFVIIYRVLRARARGGKDGRVWQDSKKVADTVDSLLKEPQCLKFQRQKSNE